MGIRDSKDLNELMRKHSKAQAEAGEGTLGDARRFFNNTKEFGLNQLSIAQSLVGLNTKRGLSSSQRAEATARGKQNTDFKTRLRVQHMRESDAIYGQSLLDHFVPDRRIDAPSNNDENFKQSLSAALLNGRSKVHEDPEKHMREFEKAQADAGTGRIGDARRFLNSTKEFGLNQFSLAGKALGFKMTERLSFSDRAGATSIGLENAKQRSVEKQEKRAQAHEALRQKYTRQQADTGTGFFGGVQRFLNNTAEFGLNQVSLAGKVMGFKTGQRLSSSERAEITSKGIELRGELDGYHKHENALLASEGRFDKKGVDDGSITSEQKEQFEKRLGATLMAGHGKIAEDSSETLQWTLREALSQTDQGKSRADRGATADYFARKGASLSNWAFGEGNGKTINRINQKRQEAKKLAGHIRPQYKELRGKNREAYGYQDAAEKGEGLAKAAGEIKRDAAIAAFAFPPVAPVAGLVSLAAGAAKTGASAVSSVLREQAATKFAENVKRNASGRDMFLNNAIAEEVNKNSAQAGIDRRQAVLGIFGPVDPLGNTDIAAEISSHAVKKVATFGVNKRLTVNQRKEEKDSRAQIALNLFNARRGPESEA